MNYYSPFSDQNNNNIYIENLKYEDLSQLKENEINEGYSIEYKSTFDSNVKNKIPKIFSSFANASGGWLFLGINETTLEPENIDLGRRDAYEEISQIIIGKVYPLPIFYVKFLKSPNSDFGVIVCYIMKGKNKPYIANGTVYRRVGNISSPIDVADRFSIDLMYKESMEQSNLSLKCFGADVKENEFEIYRKINSEMRNKFGLKFDKFAGLLEGLFPVCLYIENKGAHYDEDIILRVKYSLSEEDHYFKNMHDRINKNDLIILKEYFKPKLVPHISLYDNYPTYVPNIIPSKKMIGNSPYDMKMIDDIEDEGYLSKSAKVELEYYHNFDVYYDSTNFVTTFIIKFKKISPKESKLLPTYIFLRDYVSEIEYEIISKFSFESIQGKLIKTSNN